MPEVFSTPNPALHSSIFQSLKSMAKDESLDHTKRAQANVNAGLLRMSFVCTHRFLIAIGCQVSARLRVSGSRCRTNWPCSTWLKLHPWAMSACVP